MWIHHPIWLIILYSVQINGKQECRKCKPGYYAIRQCNDLHDTVCTPCPTGSYSSAANDNEQCSQCSKCDVNSFVLKQCTTTSDVVCESCVQRKYSHLKSFRTLCEDTRGTEKMLGDGPASPETRTLNLEEGSGEDETVLDVDNKQPPKLTIIDDSPSLSDNDTLTEGSGGYAIEIETTTDFEEATTSLPVTHAPIVKTTPGPIKIQDTTIKSTDDPKTTVYSTEPLAITTKSKTVSETTPMKLTTQTTVAPTTTTTTTTTSQEGVININDKGIIITHKEIVESEDDTGVDIFPEDVSTKKNEQLHHPNSGFDKTTPVPYSGNLAAQKVQNKEDGNTVTIGVLIAAVLAVAFIFFFIGFLVAKCLRRRRSGSFKVMEKMGDQTVGNGVDSKADKKHDIGIYDEIGRDPIVKKRPPSDVITPKQVDDVYAVPDKTKKKSASPKVATQLDRIKFIDETTDEELDAKEGDKLIEGGKERTGSQASIPNGKVRHSSEMEDESTPMIKSSNDKDFSSQTKLDRSYSEESQPIMSNEEIDQILSSEKESETKPEAV